jgi:predicted dehydrogenase
VSTKKVNIGLIGAGNIANEHIKGFLQFPEQCEITAITDTKLSLARERAIQHGIGQVASTTEELIARNDVDAIVICVPNQFHAPLAIQAMEAGKHILLEKPMGINGDAARQILKTSEELDRIVMIGHQKRWESIPMQIKEQIDRGELGRIYTAKTGLFRRKGIPGWGTWFTRGELSGGGPLIDIGVHMLDLALYLMGNPKPVSVYGATYAEFGPRRRGIGDWGRPNWDGTYDVEDLATALIRMEDGSTLSLEVSWAVHMDTDNTPFIHLMGTEGGASYKQDRGKLLTEKFDQPNELLLSVPDGDEGERARFCRHFLTCIREGKQPLTSARTGWTNNVIMDAIYASSRSGNEVKLNWDLQE